MMVNSDNREQPTPVPLSAAFIYWLKLGLISFGGPAGQIAIMHHDLVENRRWISERRYLHALNYCMLLPGPEAQQLATYIGWLMHRTAGGIIAGVLFVLPSAIIICLLAWVYLRFGEVPAVAAILYGIKPAVTAIVIFAAYRIGSRVLKNGLLCMLAAVAFLALAILKLPFPCIILIAALIGYIGGRLAPEKFELGTQHANSRDSYGPALIDDDTPVAAHAKFTWSRFVKVIAVGVSLWCGGMITLALYCGWRCDLTQLGWFFTQAALLTFGGAYAVLPFVYQGAVDYYHWLTPSQMIDALALGESTPGPLIIVLTFVGFVAGWTAQIFGPDHLVLAGIGAAAVVTGFTFLPSFVFILAGGPWVESTRNDFRITAPLTAISAAIVGVIVNLACFFVTQVWWPHGLSFNMDGTAVVLTMLALAGLLRFKLNVIVVILISGTLGWVLSFS